MQTVQKAVSEIWAIDDLPHVGSIEQLTPEWVQGIIAEGINATKADKSLTASGRNARLNEWRTIGKEAEALTAMVQNFLASYPDIIMCYNPEDGTLSVSEDNIDKVITQRSTMNVPELAHKHWFRLQRIIAAIEDLREWEKRNDVNPFIIREAVNYTPIAFASMWAMGDCLIDHRYDKYGRINSKSLII